MRLTSFLLSKANKKLGDVSKKFANFPDEYIARSMEQLHWRTPRAPQYSDKTIERKKFRFTTNRPWTAQFYQQNMPGTIRKKVFVEPIPPEQWMYFRGDRVEVLVGKDKGKQGIVNQVIQERNWVIVEGLNTHLRAVGADKTFPGILIQSEAPLLVTNQVKLIDPVDLLSTEVEWRFTEEGERVRVSKRTGRIIPIPSLHEETKDYKSKSLYVVREKDTEAAVVSEITFKPKLATFEMEIMESMGIEEDRIPKKTYWY
ncbi:CLUMA_CG005580, isoform A [Clunio marinus]|uniref:Large ribosomal subunit protein uL24m n=1 Tax=Clunio marinus TaxID=568069 RepID=A0A1J1HV99_9DIPT|nr:CLUMA_CG005580, isoform A [Clunio marinus]